jgi:hypothetical protein
MPVTAKSPVQSQTSLCGAFNGNSSTETDFSPSTSVFPVSITQPLMHTHSSINEAIESQELTALLKNALIEMHLDFEKRWKMILT